MGLLDFTFDVWTECYSCERIPRKELESCKPHLNNSGGKDRFPHCSRNKANLMISFLQVLPNSTEPLGVLLLKSRGFFAEAYWYWLGVGVLVGYVFLFNFVFTIALAYLNRKHSIDLSS